MADNQSSVGNHLAELYNSIHQKQQDVEAAKAQVKEAEAELEKVKGSFANYLKEAGIDKLLAPAQQGSSFTDVTAEQATSSEKKERKPRTSSEDRQAEVERNRAIYTGSYPNGLDEKTGLPKKFKGRGSANDAINAQMRDDEREYEAKQGSGAGDDLGTGDLKESSASFAAATESLVKTGEDLVKQVAGASKGGKAKK